MSSDVTQGTHVKVTINDLYKEQQETNKLLIQLASELKGLSDIPDRVRNVEIQIAKMHWIDIIAKTALGSSVASVIAAIFAFMR
jgi:homoserine kinase